MSNNIKVEIGDLLLLLPMKNHLGVVIDIDGEYYVERRGIHYQKFDRINIYCETLNPNKKVYSTPHYALVGSPQFKPSWMKVG